ncbi:hypothetical protein HOD88_02435 [archaeon]|jgi:hypothetical protein|nr:hypothetical protein [archaeon]
MGSNKKPTVEEVLQKYGGKIESQMNGGGSDSNYSQDYSKFRGEMSSELSRYERWCKSLGSIIKIKVAEKDAVKVRRSLEIAHLDLEPWQALSLGMMSFLAVFLIGLFASLAALFINGAFPFLFFFLSLILSMFLYYFINAYPERLANSWRLKASSQMVPAILYVVVYMRHTPNLEKAIAFASDHLQYPLSLDFKKVFYNVEIGKFSTIKESLDNYLETWRDYSSEFVEAFHLIEGSLFEPDQNRRIATLEKSLQVVLDGVYDKMLKFSHSVRSPLTNVYMLGVVLPTLSLAMIPLASSMLGGLVTWVHVVILFNMIVPFFVYYLTDKVLLLRPGGHGETDLLERNPLYPKYKDNSVFTKAFVICFPLFLLGILPLIFGYTPIPELMGLQSDYSFGELGLGFMGENEMFFGFIDNAGQTVGPFGLGATLLGMFFPLGLAFFFIIAYNAKTKDLIVEREKTRNLEKEFNSSLFQLGNRVGNGVPPELVFGKVAESSRGLNIEDFFRKIDFNIRNAGMSVEKAIFDKNRGAIIYYPSQLIATSMRIFLESSKKGLKIAAVSLMSISEYVKNINKISVRLNDLLAEVISDMKSNMTFLAPLLSGVVVGLSVMITSILGKMQTSLDAGQDIGIAGVENIMNIFDVLAMIPPYFLQLAVGIYLIQIIFILTGTLVTIDSGKDDLVRVNKIGKNLKIGIVLYFVVALISTLALVGLTSVVLGGMFS